MFVLKKLISQFLYPMQFCLVISFSGLILLWFSASKQRLGKLLTTFGIVMLTFLSYDGVSKSLITPLEQTYSPLQIKTNAQYISVLGSGYQPDPRLPPIGRLDDSGLARLTEGVRLYRNHPGVKMIFSGEKTGAGMAEAAKMLGVDENDILFEDKAKDTMDEAQNIHALIGNAPFILVTSASHLPRAVGLFKKLGMNPIPAPADFQSKKGFSEIRPADFFPNPRDLKRTEMAVHEYIGILWAKLIGKL